MSEREKSEILMILQPRAIPEAIESCAESAESWVLCDSACVSSSDVKSSVVGSCCAALGVGPTQACFGVAYWLPWSVETA